MGCSDDDGVQRDRPCLREIRFYPEDGKSPPSHLESAVTSLADGIRLLSFSAAREYHFLLSLSLSFSLSLSLSLSLWFSFHPASKTIRIFVARELRGPRSLITRMLRSESRSWLMFVSETAVAQRRETVIGFLWRSLIQCGRRIRQYFLAAREGRGISFTHIGRMFVPSFDLRPTSPPWRYSRGTMIRHGTHPARTHVRIISRVISWASNLRMRLRKSNDRSNEWSENRRG